MSVVAVRRELFEREADVHRRADHAALGLCEEELEVFAAVRCQDGQAIADAEAELKGRGRLVIRPSGTEPLIRVMAEGDDPAQVESVVSGLIDVISHVRNAA